MDRPQGWHAVAGFLKGVIAKSALAPGFDPIKTPHPAVNEWYAYLAQNVFLPNAALFSYLVAFGEVAIGVALILGVLTRFSALMSIWMLCRALEYTILFLLLAVVVVG